MQAGGKEKAGPNSPQNQYDCNEVFFSMENLTLRDRTCSITETEIDDKSNLKQKRKPINKFDNYAKKVGRNPSKRHQQNMKKKFSALERRIQQLQREVGSLRRMKDNCPTCEHRYNRSAYLDDASMMFERQQMNNFAGQSYNKRSSKDSVEFQSIDFSHNLMLKTEMAEKSWVLLGLTMIAMGSKVMDIDGTINVFKMLKDSVDSIRRQVQKSEEKIKLDFYASKQQMKDTTPYQEFGFDPFYEKSQKPGFCLDGLKLESVENFELFYDEKFSLSVSYQSLLTAMEYLKQHSWVSIE